MARMIALGPEHFALPFGAIGFGMAEAGADTFMETLRGLLEDRTVGLIVCGESLVPNNPSHEFTEFVELCAAAKAAVLTLPDGPEALGLGRELLKRSIEQAAGVDLLSSVEAVDDELESDND